MGRRLRAVAIGCIVVVFVGGCCNLFLGVIGGLLEYNREVAPFAELGGGVTATGGGDMGVTAGRDGIGRIHLRENVGDRELARLVGRMERFPNLDTLYLSGPKVTDVSLALLGRLKQLDMLVLDGTRASEEGKADLMRKLPNLRIEVYGTDLRERGIREESP
jgi:hypothetical protein